MHYTAKNKTSQENTDPSRSFRFLVSISGTAISDKILRPEFFPSNLIVLALGTEYQLLEGINLERVANILHI